MKKMFIVVFVLSVLIGCSVADNRNSGTPTNNGDTPQSNSPELLLMDQEYNDSSDGQYHLVRQGTGNSKKRIDIQFDVSGSVTDYDLDLYVADKWSIHGADRSTDKYLYRRLTGASDLTEDDVYTNTLRNRQIYKKYSLPTTKKAYIMIDADVDYLTVYDNNNGTVYKNHNTTYVLDVQNLQGKELLISGTGNNPNISIRTKKTTN